jgi:hypothetical protein
MTSEMRRDPDTDHLLTPHNAALETVADVVDIVLTTRLLTSA